MVIPNEMHGRLEAYLYVVSGCLTDLLAAFQLVLVFPLITKGYQNGMYLLLESVENEPENWRKCMWNLTFCFFFEVCKFLVVLYMRDSLLRSVLPENPKKHLGYIILSM